MPSPVDDTERIYVPLRSGVSDDDLHAVYGHPSHLRECRDSTACLELEDSVSQELDKIRARLHSIAPSRMATLPKSVQRLLEEDMPSLLRVAQVAVSLGWTNLLAKTDVDRGIDVKAGGVEL